MKIFLLWLAASLALLFSPAASYDYCRLTARHTLCGYRGPAPACRAVSRRGLSARERVAILDAHNKLRAMVARGETRQPSGADMRQLSWDQELARLAQAHADTCQAGSSPAQGLDTMYIRIVLCERTSHTNTLNSFTKSVGSGWELLYLVRARLQQLPGGAALAGGAEPLSVLHWQGSHRHRLAGRAHRLVLLRNIDLSHLKRDKLQVQ